MHAHSKNLPTNAILQRNIIKALRVNPSSGRLKIDLGSTRLGQRFNLSLIYVTKKERNIISYIINFWVDRFWFRYLWFKKCTYFF